MFLFMLMLTVFDVAACGASVATFGDLCACVAGFCNVVVVAISIVAAPFNIFVTRTYMCTPTICTVRM